MTLRGWLDPITHVKHRVKKLKFKTKFYLIQFFLRVSQDLFTLFLGSFKNHPFNFKLFWQNYQDVMADFLIFEQLFLDYIDLITMI